MKKKALAILIEDLKGALSGWDLSIESFIKNKKGEWLLTGQIMLITAHLLPAWGKVSFIDINFSNLCNITGSIILFAGLISSTSALISLGSNLSPLPDPKVGTSLITKGAYKRCRHPLYQSILICSFGVMVIKASCLHFLLLISLCALLVRKAKREEAKLKDIHYSYLSYQEITPAIFRSIPFLDWRN